MPQQHTRSILYLMRDLLRVLSLNPKDGKMVVHFNDGKAHQLDYVSLNPALSMKRMLDEAEKLVLASGTLEPTQEYDVLRHYLSDDGADIIYKFSCGHVIPKDNLSCMLVSSYGQAQ